MPAQEAVRLSIASERAVAARKQGLQALEQSGLRLGRIGLRAQTSLDLEGNDNIDLSMRTPKADFISRAQLGTRVVVVTSEKNVAQFALDAGYSCYAANSSWNRLFIQPGSELSFDFYAGQWWFNIYDRIAVTENAYEDPTLSGQGDYSQLKNVVGLAGIWDLNQLNLKLEYNHTTYASLTGRSSLPDAESDILGVDAALHLNSSTQLGAQLGGGPTRYVGPGANDNVNASAGVFAQIEPAQHVSLAGSAGYTVYSEQGSTTTPSGSYDAFYWQSRLTHHVNRHFDYGLTAGRTISFGYYAGTVDLYSVALDSGLHFFRDVDVRLGLVVEHGKVVFGHGDRFDRFGPHVSLERKLNAKLTASLRYQHFERTSNEPGGGYQLNVLTATIAYYL